MRTTEDLDLCACKDEPNKDVPGDQLATKNLAQSTSAFPPCLSTEVVVMFERVCREGMMLDMSIEEEASKNVRHGDDGRAGCPWTGW